MEKHFKDFESLPDVIDQIDKVLQLADNAKSRKEKNSFLKEAQVLMDEYEEYCRKGGNDKKQFNSVI